MLPPSHSARVLMILALWISPFLSFSVFAQSENDSNVPKIYWIERITPDGKLVLREYNVSSTQTLEFSDLEIWSGNFNHQDPFPFYLGHIPDFKLTLLSSGLARLKDEGNAESKYVEAQNEAKVKRIGMWQATTSSSSPNPSTSSTPASEQSESPPTEPLVDTVIRAVTGWNWERIVKIGIAVIGFLGFIELIKLLLLWRKRHRVPLLFVGLRSTGKSWLWNRISDPNISEQELNSIPATDLMVKKKAAEKKPMGRYEIVPVYFDIAGGQAGQQVTSLLDGNRRFRKLRKFLIPQKSVWILMLATTQNKEVHKDSAPADKEDVLFIREQLGHLNLPLGILGSKVTPKPEMVIVCVGKFDLFADASPNDTTAREARDKLENIFREHISRTRQECQAMRIPLEIVFCSAKKGWGTQDVLRQIQKALYS